MGFFKVVFCVRNLACLPRGDPELLFFELFTLGETLAGCNTLLFAAAFKLAFFFLSWEASEGDIASATNLLIGVILCVK